ncbi:2Fe-2S iron-sulfur cluster binding domain-containing protein [Novosphingobium sp. ERN07]|uniref:FAD-binding oxidoreductase n=1 Tax=Novosphingobium sp. ERN07 TaxID=2726187 RepID=UPI0014566449|nr:2Fe-2S iron-sulfur cluster binding domain-containing protein [Novosphingobium sp. ERN07]
MIRESAEITSFWLKPEDGALLPFLPGQHVIVRMPGGGDSRVYSLSSGVADTACRISVRRDPSRDAGFTAMLVDRIKVGDALRINGPMGSFAVHPADSSPLVLASVGVGITPFLSILRSAIALRPTRPIHLFHCTDTPAGFAFEGELQSALRLLPNLQIDVLAKAPRCSEERLAFSQARLDAVRLVSSPLFGAGARIMLCGSPGFVERLGGQLRAHGVADARWTSELFIPAGKAHFQAGSASAGSFGVKVNATLEGAWGDASNLLEWIEAAGYAAPNGCRYRACGACAARLVAGKVEYLPGVTAPTDPGTVLLCTARPASDIELETDIHPIAG